MNDLAPVIERLRPGPRRKSTPKQSADRVHKTGHFPWADGHI